ncbi:MAG: hypothetical protein M3Z06_12800, partial [Actinomycetota bacterium]|nr:hypothetical protein [Actinomycetota bacterium]
PKGARLLAQIHLQPPSGPQSQAGGVVAVYRRNPGGRVGLLPRAKTFTVFARGLAPNTKRDAYAVWLYASPSQTRLLGFVNPGVRSNGVLKTEGVLPSNAAHYSRILITRETSPQPAAPGKIVLSGKLTLG